MDLLIDGQALQTPSSRHRGIGRYTRNLLRGLAAARPRWRTVVVQNEHLEPIEGDLGGLRILPFRPPLPARPANAEANGRYYADWLAAWGPRCVLLPSLFEFQGVNPLFVGPRPPLAGILYDLIPLLFPDHYLGDPGWCGHYARSLRHLLACDSILAISEASARDLCRLAPDAHGRVANIAGATDPSFRPLPAGELAEVAAAVRARLGLEREFLFYLGAYEFRKNLDGAMRAFAALPPACRAAYDLVLACPLLPAERAALEKAGRELGIAASLKLAGFVSDQELLALNQTCRLSLFPSLYEGLGLPVLEALQCGAPVVASNNSSIPEYAGPVSWLANPCDPEALAAAIRQALAEPRDARLAERLAFARTFTWEDTAARALAVLERAGAERGAAPLPSRPRRPRVAWVSPLPPTTSGSAAYAAELLAPLREAYDLELVVDRDHPPVAPDLAARHRVLTDAECLRRHEAVPYDLFVYHLGNSPHHVYVLGLMRRVRGLVVLHDFHLGGLLLAAVSAGQWPVDLAAELEATGEEQLADCHRLGALPDWAAAELAPLNQRVLRSAGAVLVHARATWEAVRQQVSVPVALVPRPNCTPPPLGTPAEERRRLGLSPDAFLVCTLGYVGHTRRIPSLLRATASLPAEARARTHVLVVGDSPPEQTADLEKLAAELGLARQVHLTGRVPREESWRYVRAADVVVQLRHPARAESSAALQCALAVGTACIGSDRGATAELPGHVVWKVRTPFHEVEDLGVLLRELYERPEKRRALGEAGRRYAAEGPSLAEVATHYRAFMDQVSARRHDGDEDWVDHALGALADNPDVAAADALVGRWLALRQQARAKAPAYRQVA